MSWLVAVGRWNQLPAWPVNRGSWAAASGRRLALLKVALVGVVASSGDMARCRRGAVSGRGVTDDGGVMTSSLMVSGMRLELTDRKVAAMAAGDGEGRGRR